MSCGVEGVLLLNTIRYYLVALLVVAVLGFSVGVSFGYTDTDRLIADGLILGSVGALGYSVEAFEQAEQQAFTNESRAEVEASIGLVYQVAGQEAAKQGGDPTGYWQKAKEHYEAAIQLDVDNAFLYSQIGDIHFAMQDFTGAASAYRQALRYEPDSVDALYGLGRLAVGAGKRDEALEKLKKASELAPDHLGVALLLAQQLAQAGDLKQAADILLSAERFHPRAAQLHFQLALCYRGMGESEKALHQLDRTLQLDPEFKAAQELKGQLEKE